MNIDKLTKEQLIEILNELKTCEGTIYDVFENTTNPNTKIWIHAWRRYCDNSSDIEDYYPPSLINL
jgi:hypothetical protein